MMRGAITIWQRDMLVLRRNLSSELATVLAFPLTFFLTFGLGLKGYIQDIEGIPYAIFVVPGLISMSAVMGAFDDGAWGMWFHRIVQRTIEEYRVNPITVSDIIVGKIISGFTSGFFKGLAVAVSLFFLTGFRFTPYFIAVYLLFIFLGSATFSCIGSLCGTVIDKPENLGRVEAVVIMPVIFLAGLFFPLSAYPETAIPFIRAIPTTALFDGARVALLSGRIEPVYLLELAGSAVVSFLLAVRVFEKKMHG
ncbi:MAG TPA: ABC transporter permease [Thermodesulfobacteriota bacterium]|nr:ABC transporter permease [Thermodesulfobacteriota bacterium]